LHTPFFSIFASLFFNFKKIFLIVKIQAYLTIALFKEDPSAEILPEKLEQFVGENGQVQIETVIAFCAAS